MSYPTKRWLMAVLLLAWGAFLAWLALSDTIARFLGPRTYWVAWFGAAALLVAGVVTAAQAVRSPGRRAAAGDAAGVLVMLIPIALVIALPAPQLGAQAASRKAAGVGALASFVPPPDDSGTIGLEEIHYAGLSSDYAASVGITEGVEVDLVGFVTHPPKVADPHFALTRFYISCCAADAVPYSVRIRPGTSEEFADDTWLRVSGALARDDAGFIVEASSIERIEEPSSPYLY